MIGLNFPERDTAMVQNSVVLLEFNELCLSLLDRWMGEGKLPNFKRFHDSSEVYLTETDAKTPEPEPWLQWHSMHTGAATPPTCFFRLKDWSLNRRYSMWSLPRDAKAKTFNCGSMITAGYDTKGSTSLPDSWCAGGKAHLAELDRFYGVLSQQARRHTSAEDHSMLGDTDRPMESAPASG